MGVVSGTGGCGQFYDVIRILVGVSIVWENETNEQTAEHHDSPCMHRASILCFIYTVVYMYIHVLCLVYVLIMGHVSICHN